MAQSLDGVETSFTWDQALGIPQVLATSDGLTSLYGLGRLAVEQGGQWYYPQGDALGSVRQWADALAAVLAVQSYSPYGEPLSGLQVAPWGFTGEWHDPSGLVYLRARWYNGELGRFTQVDPEPGDPDAPITLHPYLYGLDAPLRYADPTGEHILLEDPRDYRPYDPNAPPAPLAVRTTPRGLRIVPHKGGSLFRNAYEWEWANFALLVESGAGWRATDVPEWPGGAFGPGFMRTINNVEWVLSTGGHPPTQWDVLLDPLLVYGCALAAVTIVGGKEGDPSAGRGLWRLTKEGASRVIESDRYGKFYKSKSDGRWWTRDRSGHGGSVWKVYEDDAAGLHHYADADEYGDYLTGKHKGPTGQFIPWSEFHGSQ